MAYTVEFSPGANELDWQARQRGGPGGIPYAQGLDKQAREAREGAAKGLSEVCNKFAVAAEVLPRRKVLTDDESQDLRQLLAGRSTDGMSNQTG